MNMKEIKEFIQYLCIIIMNLSVTSVVIIICFYLIALVFDLLQHTKMFSDIIINR